MGKISSPGVISSGPEHQSWSDWEEVGIRNLIRKLFVHASFVLCHFALDKYLSSEWSHLNTVLSVTFLYFRLFEYLLQSLISLTVTLEFQHINLFKGHKKEIQNHTHGAKYVQWQTWADSRFENISTVGWWGVGVCLPMRWLVITCD